MAKAIFRNAYISLRNLQCLFMRFVYTNSTVTQVYTLSQKTS